MLVSQLFSCDESAGVCMSVLTVSQCLCEFVSQLSGADESEFVSVSVSQQFPHDESVQVKCK